MLLRRHFARQAGHLRLEHPAEDGRDDGVRRRRRHAATPGVRRDVLAPENGQVSGQKRKLASVLSNLFTSSRKCRTNNMAYSVGQVKYYIGT